MFILPKNIPCLIVCKHFNIISLQKKARKLSYVSIHCYLILVFLSNAKGCSSEKNSLI